LGPIQADFSTPQLSFTHGLSTVTLKGTIDTKPHPTSFHQLSHFIHTNAIGSFHILTFQLTPSTPSPFISQPIPKEHNHIIQNFATIFSVPYNLALNCPYNHHIPLLPQPTPVNIKPYCYTHAHKKAMTSFIKTMLAEGIFQSNKYTISSPVS